MRLRSALVAMVLVGATMMQASAQTIVVAHPQLGVIISVNKNGETVGEAADILRAAAARAHIEITFVPLSEPSEKMLASGAADAVAPYLETPQALERYDFTAPLMTSGGGLFVRAPNTAPGDFQSLAGKIVVTPSFGPFVSYIRKNYPGVHVVVSASYQESLDQVLAGRADAAALNVQEGASVVAQSYAGKIVVPLTPFLQETLALIVLKGRHADLVERINTGLAAIRADGTLQQIEAKWNASPDSSNSHM